MGTKATFTLTFVVRDGQCAAYYLNEAFEGFYFVSDETNEVHVEVDQISSIAPLHEAVQEFFSKNNVTETSLGNLAW